MRNARRLDPLPLLLPLLADVTPQQEQSASTLTKARTKFIQTAACIISLISSFQFSWHLPIASDLTEVVVSSFQTRWCVVS
jgi:hypothetical protein